MLDIQITIEGDRVILEGLQNLAEELPEAVLRGLEVSAIGIYRRADYWLKGSGGASKKVRRDYVGFTKKSGEKVLFRQYAGAGGYPVPERTGHLRRSLAWLKPGEIKTGDVGTFTAGPNEVVIFDSAEYADVIHEGKGSSTKFGPRRYLIDAFEMFNRGMGIKRAIEDEIQKAKAKAGLK